MIIFGEILTAYMYFSYAAGFLAANVLQYFALFRATRRLKNWFIVAVLSIGMLILTAGILVFNLKNTIVLDQYGPIVIPKQQGMVVHWWTSYKENSVLLIDGKRIDQ